MATSLLFLVILFIVGFSSTSGSTISFCDDKTDDEIYLDLSNVGIKQIRKLFVSSASITCLNLSNNGMSSIDRRAFEGLPNLRSLNLSGNAIEFENFLRLYVLKKLKTLVLDSAFLMQDESRQHQNPRYPYNDRPQYDEYYDYQSTTASTMNSIYWSRSSGGKQDNFQIFPQLEKLSMCNYRTRLITNWLSKFGDMPNLTHLRLMGNKLTSDADLPRSIAKNLTHLNLDDNEVSTFSGIDLPNLRHLSLNNNNILRLCAVYCNTNSMSPRAMKDLEYLSIAGNSMVAIDVEAFANVANLMSLDLSRNTFETFTLHTFDYLTNLENLTLDDNRLERIPDICALVNLRALSINGNRVTSIDEASFCNLPKLASVSLRKNGLDDVADGTFGNLPALTRLDMSSNNISILSENWVGSGISIEELNLDANRFTDVASMSLENFESLGYLSIGQNPLREITVGSLMKLPINTTIDLARVCDNKDISTP